MTSLPRDADAEERWKDWQARGDAEDRRSATRMYRLLAFLVGALIIGLLAQLT